MTKRKDYHKPELHRITLATEEAVLSACKNNAATGPHPTGTCVDAAGNVCSSPAS